MYVLWYCVLTFKKTRIRVTFMPFLSSSSHWSLNSDRRQKCRFFRFICLFLVVVYCRSVFLFFCTDNKRKTFCFSSIQIVKIVRYKNYRYIRRKGLFFNDPFLCVFLRAFSVCILVEWIRRKGKDHPKIGFYFVPQQK